MATKKTTKKTTTKKTVSKKAPAKKKTTAEAKASAAKAPAKAKAAPSPKSEATTTAPAKAPKQIKQPREQVRDPRLPEPGTVIQKRDRQGNVRCECTVEADGVRYNDTLYRSLSAAAMAATKDLGLGGRTANGFTFWARVRAREHPVRGPHPGLGETPLWRPSVALAGPLQRHPAMRPHQVRCQGPGSFEIPEARPQPRRVDRHTTTGEGQPWKARPVIEPLPARAVFLAALIGCAPAGSGSINTGPDSGNEVGSFGQHDAGGGNKSPADAFAESGVDAAAYADQSIAQAPDLGTSTGGNGGETSGGAGGNIGGTGGQADPYPPVLSKECTGYQMLRIGRHECLRVRGSFHTTAVVLGCPTVGQGPRNEPLTCHVFTQHDQCPNAAGCCNVVEYPGLCTDHLMTGLVRGTFTTERAAMVDGRCPVPCP